LKGIFLSSNSLGGDEPFSVFHAQFDVPSIIHELYKGNNPPLYEILLHFWIKIFGISELSVRMPSYLFSALTVVFIYKIGKDYFSYIVGLTAGLLFTFSNYHLAFSHEARVYPLFALLTAVSMFSFLRTISHSRPLMYFILLVVSNTLMVYSHYFGFFVLAIQTILVVAVKDIRFKLLRNYLMCLVVIIIFYIPNIQVIWVRFFDSATNGTWVQPPRGLDSLYQMLWNFTNKPFNSVLAICILVLSASKALYKKEFRAKNIYHTVVSFWFLFPFLSMFLVSFWIPMFLDRYLVYVSLGLYLLLAITAGYLFQNSKIQLFLPFLIVIAFAITFNPDVDNRRHLREAVAKTQALRDTGTVILLSPVWYSHGFAYYFNKDIFMDIEGNNPNDSLIQNLRREKVQLVHGMPDVDYRGASSIVFLRSAHTAYRERHETILKELEKQYEFKGEYPFFDILKVYHFVKKPPSSTLE
jgi:uncharacterized membrane protein